MDHVEVKFVKDAQNRHTGWEFYPAGSIAHFNENHANALIAYDMVIPVEQGRAVNNTIESPPEIVETQPPPVPDYGSMTVKELRVEAKSAGVFQKGMRKAELVAAMESKTNEKV